MHLELQYYRIRQSIVTWIPWIAFIGVCIHSGILTHNTLQLSHMQSKLIASKSDDRVVSDSPRAICNSDGIVISWNSDMEKLLGYQADEMVGGTLQKIMGPNDWGRHVKRYQYAMDDTMTAERLTRYIFGTAIRRDGQEIKVGIRARIENRDGQRYVVADFDANPKAVLTGDAPTNWVLKRKDEQ